MDSVIISDNVKIGKQSILGPYVVIGEDFKEMTTTIGTQAIIRSHSVIYGGNKIGNNFQTGHGVLIRELNNIGDNVSIGSHSIIEHHVTIGNHVRIHSSTFIPEYSILKNGCWIGPGVIFTNARYPQSINAKKELKGPTIMQKARIGAGVVILPGVMIGKNSLVGAGSVVTKDIPDNVVVAGNPARIINSIDTLPYE